jgi:hypothetical protein
MRALATTVLLGVLASSPAFAAAPARHKVDPCFAGRTVALSGVVTAHQEYGAPGWGDDPAHDSRWTMVNLNVSNATAKRIGNLLHGCFDDPGSFTQVQLWSLKGSRALSKYQGKAVRVVGSLTAIGGAPAELRDAQVWVSHISVLQ